MQDPHHKIDELEQLLWINSRTIEQDIKVLRGNDLEEVIQINGKKFTISEIERRNNSLDMQSTVHPLFLTSNLTQIIVMLRGLQGFKDDPLLGTYSCAQAKVIWDQLSEYAKARIIYVSQNLLLDDLEWYRYLENQTGSKMFLSEKMCSGVGKNCILDCLKNGKTCCIEYRSVPMESSLFYVDCVILNVNMKESTVTIRTRTGEQLVLQLNSILASAYTSELLI